MKRITRVLAISGLGLGAALAIAAGPAQAAIVTAQPAGHSASAQAGGHWDDTDVVGYFRTRFGCERVGRLGEFHGRWDDYDCSRVWSGFNRGAWVLEVATDDWNGEWDDDNWYHGWYDGWHGGDFNGGWDHGGWHRDHGGWDGDHPDGSGRVAVFPLHSRSRSAN
ncbi:hypothetical protein ACWT_0202 [Actinoplanes sp. SE50]|nr:hypothetical protein ACPL_317 [Actinoplanes sp. SE50/110]ATO79617.1 hypothetical protein ACWT_0202 [Actinoplanes sp. SE50]SLL97020.1 hypothetical protein ACSP50_0216 [Actinoplanes sp. SE50/110]